MIKKFFRGLNSKNISYILISGQATVLYGAATFSEDIDLWVKPTVSNWNKFLRFMKDMDAKIYKLTPPISMKFIKKGHGFHFQLIAKNDEQPVWFLDIMGVVPRAGSFERAFKNITYHDTDWGRLPVLGIRELAEIKKTRRLEDYAVISNLVRIQYENLCSKEINSKDWKWILTNSFEVEDILHYLSSHRPARIIGKPLSRPCISLCLKALNNPKHKEKYIEPASKEIALEIEALRKKDRKYWEPIISQLRGMNSKRQLLIQGSNPSGSVVP